MTPTRLPLAALFAVLVGCSSEDAPSASAPPAPAEAAPLPPWPNATLQLGAPGAAPLASLRVPTKNPVDPVQVRWTHRFETTATRGVTTTDPAVVEQSRVVQVAVTPGTPTAAFSFEVLEAADTARGGPPVDPGVASALKGRTGRWEADSQCSVAGAMIDESNAGAARPHLPGVLRAIVELCPVLPSDPVGVGAQWTTTEARGAGPALTTQWRLVQMDDQQVSLTFETRSTSADSTLLAEGRVGLDRHHPIPVRFDARGRTSRQRPEAPGSTAMVTWTTAFEVHAERTAVGP